MDHWVGYTVKRTSDNCSSGSTYFGAIIANGANTLTYKGADFGSNLAFCSDGVLHDTLEIYKVEQLIDQPGRG